MDGWSAEVRWGTAARRTAKGEWEQREGLFEWPASGLRGTAEPQLTQQLRRRCSCVLPLITPSSAVPLHPQRATPADVLHAFVATHPPHHSVLVRFEAAALPLAACRRLAFLARAPQRASTRLLHQLSARGSTPHPATFSPPPLCPPLSLLAPFTRQRFARPHSFPCFFPLCPVPSPPVRGFSAHVVPAAPPASHLRWELPSDASAPSSCCPRPPSCPRLLPPRCRHPRRLSPSLRCRHRGDGLRPHTRLKTQIMRLRATQCLLLLLPWHLLRLLPP